MPTIAHEPTEVVTSERPGRSALLRAREMWAGLAIAVMWLAVLFTAVYGPDIVNSSGGGTNSSTVPSVVAVALFATLATWAVAKYGFAPRRGDR